MKATELKGMSDEQLLSTLTDTEKSLFQLRFQAATDRLEKSSDIQKARKDIARVKTEQRRRDLAKLPGQTAEQLTATLETLYAKTELPGKRRVKRTIVRLEDARAAVELRNATPATPAKGS